MLTKVILSDELQTTLTTAVSLSGVSTYDFLPAQAVILPADADEGIVFVVGGHPVHYDRLTRLTSSRCDGPDASDGEAAAHSIGHLASALWGLGCDNAVVELVGNSIPGREFSSAEYCRALTQAGQTRLSVPRRRLAICASGRVTGDDGSFIEFRPAESFMAEVVTDHPNPLGLQTARYREGITDYASDLAWARGFASSWVAADDNRWPHLSRMFSEMPPNPCDSPIVFHNRTKILTKLRSPDEPGRHQLLDLLGDLACFGHRPLGQFIAYRPNAKLVGKLIQVLCAGSQGKP